MILLRQINRIIQWGVQLLSLELFYVFQNHQDLKGKSKFDLLRSDSIPSQIFFELEVTSIYLNRLSQRILSFSNTDVRICTGVKTRSSSIDTIVAFIKEWISYCIGESYCRELLQEKRKLQRLQKIDKLTLHTISQENKIKFQKN